MAFALLKATRHDIYPFIDPRDQLKDAAKGKTILITGAGSGIGRAITEQFALAGASEIFIASRRSAALEETKATVNKTTPGCQITVFGGVDISDIDSVEKLFEALPTCPDVLVSNAAVSPPTQLLAESDPAEWLTGVDINVKGSYYIARAYSNAVFASGKEGCLINVSSNASWRYIPGRSAYALSKVALNNITEYIHREGEEKGLRCVAMHPGGVITEMTSDDLPEDIRQILIDQPALPGGLAVYLSTDRARFLGGRFVLATWDMEELEKCQDRIESDDLLRTRVLGVN